MNNLHADCDHAYGICFDSVTAEEFAKAKSLADSATKGLADFDREFGLA